MHSSPIASAAVRAGAGLSYLVTSAGLLGTGGLIGNLLSRDTGLSSVAVATYRLVIGGTLRSGPARRPAPERADRRGAVGRGRAGPAGRGRLRHGHARGQRSGTRSRRPGHDRPRVHGGRSRVGPGHGGGRRRAAPRRQPDRGRPPRRAGRRADGRGVHALLPRPAHSGRRYGRRHHGGRAAHRRRPGRGGAARPARADRGRRRGTARSGGRPGRPHRLRSCVRRLQTLAVQKGASTDTRPGGVRASRAARRRRASSAVAVTSTAVVDVTAGGRGMASGRRAA